MSVVITWVLIVTTVTSALFAVAWITLWDDRRHRLRGGAVLARVLGRSRPPHLTLVVSRPPM